MKIFISHSSKDKDSYCNEVANRLIEDIGKDKVIYDDYSFEAGEKNLNEINVNLGITDLFVIFISENSLNSNWVKHELSTSHSRFESKQLNRIYPIIISSTVKYDNPLIPEWLRDYNLKYIAQPAKAAKLITERARNDNWELHPTSFLRSDIFVGRNEQIDDFEMRVDDFEKPCLTTFIIGGLPSIGRRSFANHCIKKASIKKDCYQFSTISLSYQESIEDFILKISDLGFSHNAISIKDVSEANVEQKQQMAISIIEEMIKLDEILMIIDDGCVIDYRGNFSNWFKEIISSINTHKHIQFIIITKYKTGYETVRNLDGVYCTNIPELSVKERKGLLKRLSDAYSLELSSAELEEISRHLNGFPKQVHFAVDTIRSNGLPYLSRNNYALLDDFNTQEVSYLLEEYKDDEKVFSLLALLSKYDAISVNMLQEILKETPEYIDTYNLLFQKSFFELEGVNGEYVRLNEVIKNYIARSGAKVLAKHQIVIRNIFHEIFSSENGMWYINDMLLAIREEVQNGKKIESQYMIPSVYLKSMADSYGNMKYENVVKLARRALENQNIDCAIEREIRYLLCSALAKLKKPDCLNEIHKLSEEDDKNFLMAFYYRQTGQNSKSLDKLNFLLRKHPNYSKAKREKVLVLKNLQQYDEAMGLAKENYYLYSDNPYHIQAYFDCLINTFSQNPQEELLRELLKKLERIKSDKAQSMHRRCLALYYSYIELDFDSAINEIDRVISDFPQDKRYALIVKFDIAYHFRKNQTMINTISELEKDGTNNKNNIVICRSKLLASEGKVREAKDYFLTNIQFFTEESKKLFCEKLDKV